MRQENPILSVKDLNIQFGKSCNYCSNRANLKRNYCPECGTVYAVQDVSFELFPQEILGIVGESGSGKSTLMKSLYFDVPASSGTYAIAHSDYPYSNLFDSSRQIQQEIRNFVLGMVYQNPVNGLRMSFSSLSNIAEKLIAAGNRQVAYMEERARDLLNQVRIPEYRIKDAPKTFSGGMQQRVQIAKALSNNPPILLLDEITTGLDLSVQAKVLDIIKQIRRDFEISMILVSHDLSVIRMLADRTIVLLDGKMVESGLTDQILEDPQHAYTQELVHSLLV
jgi:putative phosphonate transport system ATP-binding protein